MRRFAILPLALLAGCNPPAADDYLARVGVAERDAPSPPILSPDTANAIWAPSAANPRRLLYGVPGQQPMFALECGKADGVPLITYTRFAAADPHAEAVLALIGNGYVERLHIDAVRAGRGWRWQGAAPAASTSFEGLTGGRQVEATVPGAGSLILNPSPLPGEFIQRCRGAAPPVAPGSAPGATGAAPPAIQPDTTDTAAPPPRRVR